MSKNADYQTFETYGSIAMQQMPKCIQICEEFNACSWEYENNISIDTTD